MLKCDVCGRQIDKVVCPYCGFDNVDQTIHHSDEEDIVRYYYKYRSNYSDRDILYESIFEIFGIPSNILDRILAKSEK